MPDNDLTDSTNLKSQYVAQVTADLEHNTKEQERISEELVGLQEQLKALQHDHSLLVSMRQALTGEAAAEDKPTAPETDGATATAPKSAALPKARKPEESVTATKSAKSKGKKAEAPKRRAPQPRAAGTPTLRELVSNHLTGQSEPRSAAEVTTALTEAHPDRKIQATVVRNTLEALVAKGHAHRTKQKKSVFYSSPAGNEQTDPTA